MSSTTKRHPSRISARYGCSPDGRLKAYDFAGDFNTGAYTSWGLTVKDRVPIHATGPYFVPAVRAKSRAFYTNETPAGAVAVSPDAGGGYLIEFVGGSIELR